LDAVPARFWTARSRGRDGEFLELDQLASSDLLLKLMERDNWEREAEEEWAKQLVLDHHR